MAKKVIQAQMQQRRDTAANWAASNPVLLDGELGIVTDDPNLYKIGDGVTAWNDLKFRGFDGTLVHTTGDSENAAMSQKAVTSKLTELESELVEERIVKLEPSEVLDGTFVQWNGSLGYQSPYKTFALDVKEGEKYRMTFPNVGGTAAYLYAIYNSEEIAAANVIKIGPNVASAMDETVVIPAGGMKLLYVGYISGAVGTISTYEYESKFDIVDEKIFSIESEQSALSEEISEKQENINEVESISKRLVVPIFSDEPMEIESFFYQKQFNADGSVRDYVYDIMNIYAVKEGTPYRIYGHTIGSGIYLYAFYSSATPSAESLVKMGTFVGGLAEVKLYDIVELAPKGATHLAVCHYASPLAGNPIALAAYSAINSADIVSSVADIDAQVNKLNADIDAIEDSIYIQNEVAVSGEKIDATRLNMNGNLEEGQSLFAVYRFSVKAGEKYRIYRVGDTGSTGSRTYALYNNNEASAESVVVLGPEFNDPIDEVVVIPDGVVLMVVGQVTTNINNVVKIVSENRLNAVTAPCFAVDIVSNEEIAITRRYSSSQDVRVTLKKCGANNLMQIYSHGFVNNSENIPSFSAEVTTKKAGSDWIGPYVMKADNRAGSYNGFTGGWHGYNGDQTGAKTAETTSVEILVDNRTKEVGKYYANRVKVVVTNLVQGGNTKTEDGNGVNILKEVVTYDFKEEKIYVSVQMEALEALTIQKYYGMQVNNYYGNRIAFYADTINEKAWADGVASGNKDILFMICKDAEGRCAKAYLDVAGLGYKKNAADAYAFVSGAKAYFWLIGTPLTLADGEKTYWSGYYQFSPNDNVL